MRHEYRTRVVDEILSFYLECMGAVLIEGPKWCGKTRTGEEQSKSIIKLQDPNNVEKYRAAMKAKPTILLEGPSPRLEGGGKRGGRVRTDCHSKLPQ